MTHSLYSFLLEAESTTRPCWWKIPVTIQYGNRTRDIPACSAVPQPTTPPRVSLSYSIHRNMFAWQRCSVTTYVLTQPPCIMGQTAGRHYVVIGFRCYGVLRKVDEKPSRLSTFRDDVSSSSSKISIPPVIRFVVNLFWYIDRWEIE
jgi:hypothetical protein